MLERFRRGTGSLAFACIDSNDRDAFADVLNESPRFF